MKVNKIIALSTLVLGIVAAVLALVLVQPPSSWALSSQEFYFSLCANILTFVLHVGAAAFFLLSLTVYKAKLRTAFTGIVLGIVLIALGTLQLPVLDAINGWNSSYVTGGFVGLPFLLSGLLAYFGAAQFGKLVGTGGLAANKFVVIPASVATAALTLLIPHVETTVDELTFDASNFILGWTATLLIASAVVFFRVASKSGAHYKNALAWLSLALLGSTSCLIIAITDTLISTAVRDPLTEALNILTIVAGLIWLKAGYAFTKTKEF
jgi:hypothetical protein